MPLPDNLLTQGGCGCRQENNQAKSHQIINSYASFLEVESQQQTTVFTAGTKLSQNLKQEKLK